MAVSPQSRSYPEIENWYPLTAVNIGARCGLPFKKRRTTIIYVLLPYTYMQQKGRQGLIMQEIIFHRMYKLQSLCVSIEETYIIYKSFYAVSFLLATNFCFHFKFQMTKTSEDERCL